MLTFLVFLDRFYQFTFDLNGLFCLQDNLAGNTTLLHLVLVVDVVC